MALTLRPDAEFDHALTALAAAEGMSKQEVVRHAVLDRYERARHAAAVAEAADRSIDTWGAVLDRLR